MCDDKHDDMTNKHCHGDDHKGHGRHGRKEILKQLDGQSLDMLLLKTAHRLLHSSDEDLKNSAAFENLSPIQKTELRTLLEKVSDNIKLEKHHKTEKSGQDENSGAETNSENA